MNKYIFLSILFFLFIQNHLLAQSSCATAIPMTASTQYCGSTQGQPGDFPNDGSAPMNPCDSTYNENEYWFSIVGTGTTSIYTQYFSTSDTEVFVFDNCAGNSPNCVGYSGGGYLLTDLLANGVTYYIVVISEDSPNIQDFCLSIELIPCVPGTSCNDFDPCTTDDYWDFDPFFGCNCTGIPVTQGEPCDDGDSLTINDQISWNCECRGTPFCEVGTPCDDNDPNTVNDRRVSTDCTCEGTPLPCELESGFFARDTIAGCTNPIAPNYDPSANYDNGTCELGKIGGSIWKDNNQNGVFDSGDWYFWPPQKVYLLDASSNPIDSTLFGSGGVYLFDNLPTPNTYSIVVDLPTTLCISSHTILQTYDPDGTLDDTHTLSIEAGDCFNNIDFGYDCDPI